MSDERDPATRAGAATYRIAGAAMRQAHARATQMFTALSGTDWRVLLAVLHCTVSYSKLEEEISLRRLAQLVNLPKPETKKTAQRVAAALRKLQELGVITYQPGDKRHGRVMVSRVGIPADERDPSWGVPSDMEGTLAQGSLLGPQGTPARDSKGPTRGVPKGPTPGGPVLEKKLETDERARANEAARALTRNRAKHPCTKEELAEELATRTLARYPEDIPVMLALFDEERARDVSA